MYEKRFEGDIARLRNPERIARLEMDRVVSLSMEGTKIHSVLDCGTGSGLFAEAFVKRGLTVYGIDVSLEMLQTARSYVPAGNFCQSTAEALPFADDSFDLVYMGLVLHESDEQLQVLSEAHRLARSGVGILEWFFRQEEIGAPLAYRLNPDLLSAMAMETGYKQFEAFPLTTLVFYLLSV
jgi:ubiquinone/menaquinone biosynthesis C-methylase UbiE